MSQPYEQYQPIPGMAPPQYGQPQFAPPQQPNPYQQPPQQFAPQGYPQQYAPQQPQPQGQPLAAGSLDSYFSQPSTGGGAALKFPVGTTHVGIVSRAVTNADVQQQTQPQTGIPQFYKDGRPKFVMKVPLTVQPSQEHPEGQAQWYCAGAARDELMRAMAEVGAPEGPPEKGALIQVTCTGTRPAGAGFNPAKVWSVVYRRPEGVAANGAYGVGAVPAAQNPAPAQQAPTQPAPAPQYQAPIPQGPPPQGPPPQPMATTPPVGPQQPQPSAVPPENIPPAADLSEQQRALLAQLTNPQK